MVHIYTFLNYSETVTDSQIPFRMIVNGFGVGNDRNESTTQNNSYKSLRIDPGRGGYASFFSLLLPGSYDKTSIKPHVPPFIGCTLAGSRLRHSEGARTSRPRRCGYELWSIPMYSIAGHLTFKIPSMTCDVAFIRTSIIIVPVTPSPRLTDTSHRERR